MNLLPFLILGTTALLLHLVLTIAVAPPVASLIDGVAGLFTGASRLPIEPSRYDFSYASRRAVSAAAMRPWRTIRDLMAKEPVRAGDASPLSNAAPLLSLAVTLSAAFLVPSFATGMLTASFADLAAVLALLATARVILLLGAFDGGIALPGLASVSSSVGLLLAAPGCVLGLYALDAATGSTNLDRLLPGLHGGSGVLAGLCLALAALAAGGNEAALSDPLSGPDLALVRLQSALQVVIWIDLVSALLFPGTLAVAQSGPLNWLLGLILWAVRLAAGVVVLAAVRRSVATVPARRRLAGFAVLLGALAPLLLLVGGSAE